ncbi:MAG TPA: hypothetical protein ACFE0H_12010 [Elainellaceae cyanobacterium]
MNIKFVLADSFYGESGAFIATLGQFNLPFIWAIRSNHGVLMPGQQIRYNRFLSYIVGPQN